MNEMSAIVKTAGRKNSSICSFLYCGSFTVFIIWDKIASLPTLVALTLSIPSFAIIPPVTSDPSLSAQA